MTFTKEFGQLFQRLESGGLEIALGDKILAQSLFFELDNIYKDKLALPPDQKFEASEDGLGQIIADHLRPILVRSQNFPEFDDIVQRWFFPPDVKVPVNLGEGRIIKPTPSPRPNRRRLIAWCATLFGILSVILTISSFSPPWDKSDSTPNSVKPVTSTQNTYLPSGGLAGSTDIKSLNYDESDFDSSLRYDAKMKLLSDLQSDFGAPTLREIFTSGVFESMTLEDASEKLGVKTDQPLNLRGQFFQRLSWLTLGSVAEPSELGQLSHTQRRNLIEGIDSLRLLTNHTSDVNSVAFSPKGDVLASGSDDNTIKLWDVKSGKALSTFTGHEGIVYSVVFSPQEDVLASGSSDKTIRLWDVKSGEALSSFTGHENYVVSVAFSPKGDVLASGSDDHTIRLWDVKSGEVLHTLTAHEDSVASVAFSPKGDVLASGSYDSTIRLWDVKSGDVIAVLTDHTSDVNSVAFSPKGEVLASGSDDNTIKLWDVKSGKALSTFTGHEDLVRSVAFSSKGDVLASGSEDDTTRLWDVKSRKALSILSRHENYVVSVAFSPQGDVLASGTGENTIHLWDIGYQQTFDFLSGAYKGYKSFDDVTAWAKTLELDVTSNESAEIFARLLSATAFEQGWDFRIVDPPWTAPALHSQLPNYWVNWGKDRFPWLMSVLCLLIGIGTWVYRASRELQFLGRNQIGDIEHIKDHILYVRRDLEALTDGIRRAATAMLVREEGAYEFDIRKSIQATSAAAGLITAVETRFLRLPQYLFLVDTQSIEDHGTQRMLDYINRLAREHVDLNVYFFDKTPAFVRKKLKGPAQPLENIIAENRGRRLVLYADAANFVEIYGLRTGKWLQTLKSWKDRALLTSVPISEWGAEEQLVAKDGELAIAPLSTQGLALLPMTFTASEGLQRHRLLEQGSLRIAGQPEFIRVNVNELTSSIRPPDKIVERLMRSLMFYLDDESCRWFFACAIFPILRWDLTLALGIVLKDKGKNQILTETRMAKLAELPWMRKAYIPGWLRERMMEELEEPDIAETMKFFAGIFDSKEILNNNAKNVAKIAGHVSRRDSDRLSEDEHFLKYVTQRSTTESIKAAKRLRKHLKINWVSRLLSFRNVQPLLWGGVIAAFAFFATPKLIRSGVGILDVAGWITLGLVFLGGWILLKLHPLRSIWHIVKRLKSFPTETLIKYCKFWVLTNFGYVDTVAKEGRINGFKSISSKSIEKIIRRRAIVFHAAFIWLIFIVICLSIVPRHRVLDVYSSERKFFDTIWPEENILWLMFAILCVGTLWGVRIVNRTILIWLNRFADLVEQTPMLIKDCIAKRLSRKETKIFSMTFLQKYSFKRTLNHKSRDFSWWTILSIAGLIILPWFLDWFKGYSQNAYYFYWALGIYALVGSFHWWVLRRYSYAVRSTDGLSSPTKENGARTKKEKMKKRVSKKHAKK